MPKFTAQLDLPAGEILMENENKITKKSTKYQGVFRRSTKMCRLPQLLAKEAARDETSDMTPRYSNKEEALHAAAGTWTEIPVSCSVPEKTQPKSLDLSKVMWT